MNIKALDVIIAYGDIRNSFSIYTPNITINLPELINQSFLPSSLLPIKLYMGEEYNAKAIEGRLDADINLVREEIRKKVNEMTQSKDVLSILEDAIQTAKDWFGN